MQMNFYRDADAFADGVLIDISNLGIIANNCPVNLMIREAKSLVDTSELKQLVSGAGFESTDRDAWGNFEHNGIIFWLTPNEFGGLTLLLPDNIK